MRCQACIRSDGGDGKVVFVGISKHTGSGLENSDESKRGGTVPLERGHNVLSTITLSPSESRDQIITAPPESGD